MSLGSVKPHANGRLFASPTIRRRDHEGRFRVGSRH
jgi:hypothetical protein